jgi:N-acetyl-anhydromuramyl-L-alanine amidase AmpD
MADKKIKYVVIHCSGSSFGNVKLITDWHKARGWRTVGYHYVIGNGYPTTTKQFVPASDGLLEKGRLVDNDDFIESPEVGAHVEGHNVESIGICLVGNGKYTKKQLVTLVKLLEELLQIHKAVVCVDSIVGHYELNPEKTCPIINMKKFREWLKSNMYLGGNLTFEKFL